jgi:hypothetical protein
MFAIDSRPSPIALVALRHADEVLNRHSQGERGEYGINEMIGKLVAYLDTIQGSTNCDAIVRDTALLVKHASSEVPTIPSAPVNVPKS